MATMGPYASAERTIESSGVCPSTRQSELASLLGAEVTVRYVVYRDTFFLPRIRVYEFVSGGRSIWSFSESASHEESMRGLTKLLTVLAGLAGVGLAWHGWREIKAAWVGTE